MEAKMESLINEWAVFCRVNDYPHISADELLVEYFDWMPMIHVEQVKGFIRRWDRTARS